MAKTLKERYDGVVGEMEKMLRRAERQGRKELTADETEKYGRLEGQKALLEEMGDEAPRAARLVGSNEPLRPGAGTFTTNGATVQNAGDQDNGGFESMGEFMAALSNKARGLGYDDRLRPLAAIGKDQGSTGGFAVPQQFVYKAFTEADDGAVLLNLCDKVPMTSDKASAPMFSDKTHSTSPFGITWQQIPESGTINLQEVTLDKLQLEAHKSGCLFSITNEWLADAAPEMRSRVDGIFTASLRWYCEQLLWNGTGAGQPLGVLNAPGTLSISKESNQAADTIITANVVKLWARLRPGSHSRAVWVANPTTFPQLAQLTITSGTGGAPVGLLQPSGIAGGPAMSILGRPLYLSEHVPVLGDEGDLNLVDPMLYVMGERQSIVIDASPHYRFNLDETTFRCTARFDGQPVLDSVLTPKNGDTVAWAVNIAARA